MTIGRFAEISGLSVKALRFYDDKGLLVPYEVDTGNGYRRYRAAQLRRAVTIRVLREMGMSLAQVREILDNPDRSADLLARFREDLARERAAQDAAVERATWTLDAYDQTLTVRYRDVAEQHWAGLLMEVDATLADEARTEESNEAFAGLARELHRSGNAPVGMFWTTIRAETPARGEDPPRAEVVLCWPVARPVTGLVADGRPVLTGTLPPGREAFVTLDFSAPDHPAGGPGEGAPHPGFLALLEELEQAGSDGDVVRQIGVPGPDGTPVGIEIAVQLTPTD